MVVSAHPMASKTGAAVLKKGGNAVDAAVATSMMLGVVEPAFSGIGGGGFALLHTSSGENVAFDYRETAPLGSWADMFADGSDKNRIGPLATATPGLLSGHAKLLEEYGTMKFADLARPAAEVAKSGISSQSLSRKMLRDRESGTYRKIRRFKTSSEVFLGRGRFPLLGRTIANLITKGPDEFYTGSIPEIVAGYLEEIGGVLSEEDFERYTPKKREPVTGEYRGFDLISMPPPSAGGTLLVYGLMLSEELGEGRSSSRSELLNVAAILRSMLAEKWRFGDPAFGGSPVSSLLSEETVQGVAQEIRFGDGSPGESAQAGRGSTSHFSVVDRQGNAVAVTETIECYYGSGVTIPGLGVVMNDEMHDFDVVPGGPNSVAPGKRPASSMAPTMVLKDGRPFLVIGGAGSERIISSVFQTIRNVIEGGMSLKKAVAHPRIHFSGGRLEVEGETKKEALSGLRSRGFVPHIRTRGDSYFGGVHAIMIEPSSGKVMGAPDPRRMGTAASD